MMLLERLIRRLRLEPVPDTADAFTGRSGAGGVTNDDRLFGGLVAAQATMAAQLTVTDFPLHSLHAYFLRPGRPDADIIFQVDRVKEGRNFRTRNVVAIQKEEVVFQLQASGQRRG